MRISKKQKIIIIKKNSILRFGCYCCCCLRVRKHKLFDVFIV